MPSKPDRPYAWLLTIECFNGTEEVVVKIAKTLAIAVTEVLQRSGRRSVRAAVALSREEYESSRPKVRPSAHHPRRWNLK